MLKCGCMQSLLLSFWWCIKIYIYTHKKLTHILRKKKVYLSTVPEEDIFCLHHIIFWWCSTYPCFETVIAQGIFYYIFTYPTKHTICESIILLSFLFFWMSNCIWDKENIKNVHWLCIVQSLRNWLWLEMFVKKLTGYPVYFSILLKMGLHTRVWKSRKSLQSKHDIFMFKAAATMDMNGNEI